MVLMWFRHLSVLLEYLYWQITGKDTDKPLRSRFVNAVVLIVENNSTLSKQSLCFDNIFTCNQLLADFPIPDVKP